MSEPPGTQRLALLVHEVRSPVAALTAIAEAFRDPGVVGPPRRELVRLAIAACRGIERFAVDAILTSVRSEMLDPAALVRESVAVAALDGADVQARVDSDLPTIEGDPIRLRQALDNLVGNALTHSEARGSVVVSAARSTSGEDRVLLSVSDTGVGIPERDQRRIFEPGVRLDPGHPGSGLGLAIARAVAEAHGGVLSVSSTPGGGATFTLALPLRVSPSS